MDQSVTEQLYENFKVEIKPGSQGYKYVRTRHVLDRMNKTFGVNWGVKVIEHKVQDGEVLVLVSVYLYDPPGHVAASQEGFGSAKIFKGVELGNIFKSAMSKAIKSAVRNWGVALFLDEDDDESYSNNTASTSPPNMGNAPSNTPPANPSSMPPSNIPSNTPADNGTPLGGTPLGVEPKKEEEQKPEQKVKEDTSTPPQNLGNGMPSSGQPSTFPPSFNQGDVPKEPTDQGLPPMNAVPGQEEQSAPNSNSKITEIQKTAITARIGTKNKTFDQVIEDFWTDSDRPAPSTLDDLTYEDALDMVAYLNKIK